MGLSSIIRRKHSQRNRPSLAEGFGEILRVSWRRIATEFRIPVRIAIPFDPQNPEDADAAGGVAEANARGGWTTGR